jgi:hypothetical protein
MSDYDIDTEAALDVLKNAARQAMTLEARCTIWRAAYHICGTGRAS